MEDGSAVVDRDVSKEPRLSRGGLRLLKDEITIQSGCDASRHGPEDLKRAGRNEVAIRGDETGPMTRCGTGAQARATKVGAPAATRHPRGLAKEPAEPCQGRWEKASLNLSVILRPETLNGHRGSDDLHREAWRQSA